MARQLQATFIGFTKKADQRKALVKQLNEELTSHNSYDKIKEDLDRARQAMKDLKNSVLSSFEKDVEKLEKLKLDIDSEKMLMSDMALNQIIKGQTINIKDEWDNEYEPLFTVKFKKIK